MQSHNYTHGRAPERAIPSMPDGAVRKLPRMCSSADTPPLVLSSGHWGTAIASGALLGPDHVSCRFYAKRDIVRTASYRMLRSAAGAAGAQDLVANP